MRFSTTATPRYFLFCGSKVLDTMTDNIRRVMCLSAAAHSQFSNVGGCGAKYIGSTLPLRDMVRDVP